MQKERSFYLNSSSKTRQPATRADNPMTRNKDQQRILSARSANGARRTGTPDHSGNLTVGPRFSIRHLKQRMIDRLFKRRPSNTQRQIKHAADTGKILLQLSAGFHQERSRAIFIAVVSPDTDCTDNLILFLTKAHQTNRR